MAFDATKTAPATWPGTAQLTASGADVSVAITNPTDTAMYYAVAAQ